MGKHKPVSPPAIEVARWIVGEVLARGYDVAARAELLERIAARPWVKPDYINEALRGLATSVYPKLAWNATYAERQPREIERGVAGVIAAAARADLVVTALEAANVSARLEPSPAEEAAVVAALTAAKARWAKAREAAEALPEYRALEAAREALRVAEAAYEAHPAVREVIRAEAAVDSYLRQHSLLKTTTHRQRLDHLRTLAGPTVAKELC